MPHHYNGAASKSAPLTPPRERVGPEVPLEIPIKFLPLLEPRRYKVYWGGRGGAKSWSFARALIVTSLCRPCVILCTRAYQNSIADSVHRLLAAQIRAMGLSEYFQILKQSIVCRYTGAQFIFKGLQNIAELRSTEEVDICWLEEANVTALDSWRLLVPTIRKPGSEIWLSFNPDQDDDPVYVEFVIKKHPDAFVENVNWFDNPWLSDELEAERRYMMRRDPDAYDWVWEGHCRRISDAMIFKGRFVVEDFETPDDVERFYYGADWGFAQDPSVLIRDFIRDNKLYIDHEAYAVGVELDDLEYLFAGGTAKKTGTEYPGVPDARHWPIKADSSRPETISYMGRRGFNISAAEKWKGCVEDGIEHLRGFDQIVIHPRCRYMAQEARLYSYKIDKRSNLVLPKPEDKHNHTWDAVRYSLDGYIQSRGGLGVWAKLAQ